MADFTVETRTSGGEGTATYTVSGNTVTLYAVPAAGYEFNEWVGYFVDSTGTIIPGTLFTSSDAEHAVTVTTTDPETKKVVATAWFGSEPTPRYTVTVAASPANGGTVTGGGAYGMGEWCSITATPATDYSFRKWRRDATGEETTDATYGFAVYESCVWVAYFRKTTYHVGVVASPDRYGDVTGGGTYEVGTMCTITATPRAGYRFGWWEANDGSANVTTRTHSFYVRNAVIWIARFFEATGKILHSPSNGRILHGAAGTILYDG